MVATSRTRNAVVRKGTWVRIPPSPPSIPTLVGANELAYCGGLIFCLKIASEILAFYTLFTGVHGRTHMEISSADGSLKSASVNGQKYTSSKGLRVIVY